MIASANRLAAADQKAMPRFPPIVAAKIMRFLDAGLTGTLELHVKEGRVLAYKLVETGRVSALDLDSRDGDAQD